MNFLIEIIEKSDKELAKKIKTLFYNIEDINRFSDLNKILREYIENQVDGKLAATYLLLHEDCKSKTFKELEEKCNRMFGHYFSKVWEKRDKFVAK